MNASNDFDKQRSEKQLLNIKYCINPESNQSIRNQADQIVHVAEPTKSDFDQSIKQNNRLYHPAATYTTDRRREAILLQRWK